MYLRFITPAVPGGYTATRCHVAPGLFGPAYGLWRNHRDTPTPALIGIRREIDWFEDWLPVPNRFGVKSKGRWYSDGVCWFRDSARDMLGHAYALAALIEEFGVRIDRVRSNDPGQILYRDDYQIVAKPNRFGPQPLRKSRSKPPPAGPITRLIGRIGQWVCRGIL